MRGVRLAFVDANLLDVWTMIDDDAATASASDDEEVAVTDGKLRRNVPAEQSGLWERQRGWLTERMCDLGPAWQPLVVWPEFVSYVSAAHVPNTHSISQSSGPTEQLNG